MKELSSKFLILLHYVPYIIDEKQKFDVFLAIFLLCLKRESNMIIQKLSRRLWEKKISVMTNIKTKEKVYVIGKIKNMKVFDRKRKAKFFIKIQEIIIEVTNEVILKITSVDPS